MNRDGLPRVRRGQPITAALFNRLAEYIQRALNISGGDGVLVRHTAGGLTIGLAPGQVLHTWCKVRAVNDPSGQGPDNPVDLSEVSYDIKPYGRPQDPLIPAVFPRYGRPIAGAEVIGYKARIGDLCLLLRHIGENDQPTHELMILSEKIAFGDCPPPESPPPPENLA